MKVWPQLFWDRCRAGVAGEVSQWQWVYFRVGVSHCTWSHIPLRFGMATKSYLRDGFGRCLCASGRQAGSLAGRKGKLCVFNVLSGVNGRAAPTSAQLYCKLVL